MLPPFLDNAKYVAELRNYHWQYEMHRRGINSGEIRLSTIDKPYPSKNAAISDEPVSDKGNNFGRIARSGIMDDFTAKNDARLLSGIPAGMWRRFLLLFKDATTEASIEQAFGRLKREIRNSANVDDDQLDEALSKARAILNVLLDAS